MPVLNAAPYLSEAVESVLQQTTNAPWELLIIDDGSLDGSRAVAERYHRAHPERIHLLQHAEGGNRGTSASRNLGLHCARGQVIAFLDGDDVWLPHMLEHQLALMARYPEASLVYANAERTWNMGLACPAAREPRKGENTLPALLPAGRRPGLLQPPEPLPWFLENEELTPCTCTVLVRAEAARRAGGFVEDFQGVYDDQAFYAKLMLQGRTAVSEACVARYRKHADSCCARTWADTTLQLAARARFEEWLASYREAFLAETEAVAVAD